MRKINLVVIGALFFASCKTDSKPKDASDKVANSENQIPKESDLLANKNFVQDTIVIHNLFDDKSFKNDTMLNLLDELDICNTDLKAKFDIHNPPCEPRFYKFYKYNKNLALHDGFALEIRAGVDDFPLRRFIVFKRMNGKLVKLNGFVANLVEMQTKPSGFNDLILLFRDQEAGSFVVKYVWDNKKMTYDYKSLEAVDGRLVKEELKDSLSTVVSKRLENNHMFF